MQLTEHYRMYAEVFGLDVPLTQSQLTESTQGTNRTLSAPRRSSHLTPPAPVSTVDEADDMILQDTIQVSLAEQKSHEEQETKENMELVNEHLAAEEIEKMVEEPENVVDDSSNPRNDEHDIPGTRIEPRSDKESPEVEITDSEKVDNMETEITNVVIPVNVDEDEEEITDEVYELKQREKGKIVEESRSTLSPTPIRSLRIHDTLVSSDTEKLQELTAISTPSFSSSSTKLSNTNRLLSLFKAKPGHFKSYKSFFHELQGLILERQQNREEMAKMIIAAIQQERGNLKAEIYSQIQNVIANNIPSQVDALVRSYMSGHILHAHPAQPTTISAQEQQYQLYLSMKDDL
ncbi:hypothetical protein Tco_0983113 [Tanacetum coccineum]